MTHVSDLVDGHGWDELQLRGLIAFAARCARRLFPFFVLNNEPLFRERDAAIAMAESFAAGEPGDLIQARRVRDQAPGSAGALARATVSAFTAARSLELEDESDFRRRLDGVAERDHPAFLDAFRETRSSARMPMDLLLHLDRDQAPDMMRRDCRLLKLSHLASKDFRGNPVPELGMGIDTSDRGPLGPLWEQGHDPEWFKDGMGLWQKPVEMSVAPGKEFLSVLRTLKTFPDIVCWYSRPDAGAGELDEVELSLKQVVSTCREIGRIRPALSVYAPEIPEEHRLRLIDLGATVYHVPLDKWFTPTDDESFSRMLQDRLQKSLLGWKSDENGLWRRDDSRIDWRTMRTRSADPDAPVVVTPAALHEADEAEIRTLSEWRRSHGTARLPRGQSATWASPPGEG